MNLPDHMPTTDDRYQQFTGVWTNQLSDKSVWTTACVVGELQHPVLDQGQGTVAVRHPQPRVLEREHRHPAARRILFFATHGDYPTYSKRNSTIYTLKSDFSTRKVRAAHVQDRPGSALQPGRKPDPDPAELGEQRPAGRRRARRS